MASRYKKPGSKIVRIMMLPAGVSGAAVRRSPARAGVQREQSPRKRGGGIASKRGRL